MRQMNMALYKESNVYLPTKVAGDSKRNKGNTAQSGKR